VNQAVSNLDQMTQQNAALVEESSAAALSMQEQARRLAEVVSVFKLERNAEAFTTVSAVVPRPLATIKALNPAAHPAVAVPRPVASRSKAQSLASTAEDDSWEQF
ncbi:chemotaxis protein, partial [Comamonas thiooxydans]